MKPRRVPKLCRRRDGRLYVTDPASGSQVPIRSQADYEAWRAEFLARGEADAAGDLRPRCSVEELLDAYLDFAEGYYRKRGQPSSHVHARVRPAILGCLACWAGRSASSIRPADVEALQRHFVAEGRVRDSVNALTGKIREIWRWGVRKEAVDAAALERMRAVPGLKKGRSTAVDNPPVEAVAVEVVEATLAKLTPPANWCVRLQLLTGARPGEACRLQPSWLDRTASPWLATVPPEWDKSAHLRGPRDKPRVLRLGPKAQALLAPLLGEPGQPLFRCRGGKPFTEAAYYRRVRRACVRAGVEVWTPNQLRHTAATEVRRYYGAEAARLFLGHQRLETTEIYAERDEELLKRIASGM